MNRIEQGMRGMVRVAVVVVALFAVSGVQADSSLDQLVEVSLPSFQDRLEAVSERLAPESRSEEHARSLESLGTWIEGAQGLVGRPDRTAEEDFQLSLLFSLIRGTLTELEQAAG